MSSSGATKSKPKKSSNLRILWIPGRKKHNRKGTFNPTKNGLPQTYGMQPRKNEPWTLGGPLNQTKIINADLHENNLDVTTIVASGTTMGLAALATSSTNETSIKTNGVAIIDQQQQQLLQDQDRLQQGEEPIPSTSQTPPQIVVGTVELNNLNGDAPSNKEKEISTSNQFAALTLIDEDDEEEKDRNCSNAHSSSSLLSSNNDNRSAEDNSNVVMLHNAATLSISEQHRRQQGRRRRSSSSSQKRRRSGGGGGGAEEEDVDSIDRVDDSSTIDLAHGEHPNGDGVDGERRDADVMLHQLHPDHPDAAVLRKRKNKKRSQRRRGEATRQQQESAADAVDGRWEVEPEKEPYEKAVTCLYWSLACWDCNIS